MDTHAVAFTTDDGPELHDGPSSGFPDDCFILSWVVEFFVTQKSGLAPARSATAGHVVQHVEVSKKVFECDGTTPDTVRSQVKDFWEVFDIQASGVPNASDTNQTSFPKDRITELEIKLSAGYVDRIVGATRTNLTVPNPYGADAKLSTQPSGFRVSLTRTYSAKINCCAGGGATWTVGSNNAWGSYDEKWSGEGSLVTSHGKKVDGRQVP